MTPHMKTITLLFATALCSGTTLVADGESPKKTAPATSTQPQKKPPSVIVMPVQEQHETLRRKCVGFVTPIERVDLVTRVAGDLITVGFRDGDCVQKGQLLYKIDDLRYNAALKSAQSGLAQAQARATYAQAAYARRNELAQRHAVSVDAMENARSENEMAQATLLDCEAKLILAQDDLTNTVIRAPISGKISATAYTRGNYLTPSSGILATIVQQDPIRVGFTVGNKDMLAMFGDEATLRKKGVVRVILANGQEYAHTGTIDYIDNRANRQTDALRIFACFKNPTRMLVPDSAVTIILETTSERLYPAVRPSAVLYDDQGAYVYRLDNANRVERRPVTTGLNTGAWQIIHEGLTVQDRVIEEGTLKVMPGMEVTPIVQEK